MISHLQAREPGKLVVLIQCKTKGLRIDRGWWCLSQSEFKTQTEKKKKIQGQEKMDVSAPAEMEFAFFLPFCPLHSIQSLCRLNGAHPQWWGWSIFSLPIQMLMFSGVTLTETPRKNVLPVIWSSLSPAKWKNKSTITHTKWIFLKSGFPSWDSDSMPCTLMAASQGDHWGRECSVWAREI